MKNKRGFVLSLDAFLSIIVLVLVISFITSSFFQTPERTQYIYSVKEANDVIAVLDYEDVLDTLDESKISQGFSNLLESSEGKFNITYDDVDLTGEDNLFVNENKTEKGFVISGKRFFVIKDSTGTVEQFAVVSYSIWKK